MEFTTLVLGSGGIKGYCIMGALMYLSCRNLLSKVTRIVGVSVGAIIGFLLAAKISIFEIIVEGFDTDLTIDTSMESIAQIPKQLGILNNHEIKIRLQNLLEKKWGRRDVSLRELYDLTGIELVCTALNITTEKTEYFSPFTHPEVSAIDAVLASMNIPFLFHQFKIGDCYYVDGALGNPAPASEYNADNVLQILVKNEAPNIATIGGYLQAILNSVFVQLSSISLPNVTNLLLTTACTSTIACGEKEKITLLMEGFQQAAQKL